jgi:hypothetical protein
MTTDYKKTDAKNLIAKINTQGEIIEKQNIVYSIDIDIQLGYIRALYEFYTELKQNQHIVPKQEQEQNLVSKEQTGKRHHNLSECGTLSLFDNLEEMNENINEEKDIAITEPSSENQIQTEMQKDPDDEISTSSALSEISEFEKQEQITSPQIEDSKEDTKDIKVFLEENTEDIKAFSEEDTEGIEVSPEEDTKKDTEAIEVLPEMEFEINLKKNDFPAINQDNITIAEKELPFTPVETSTQPQHHEIEEPVHNKPTSIGDKYKSNRPSLNEIVSGFKPDESIGMKLQHGNVSDLMKSIDMNYKFLFVKNLFKGNGSAFTEEINKINNIPKLHQAISYMEELKDKYKWDEKSEAYKELFNLVLRKYAK